ncbi:hypothetical protein C6P40_004694 [Pichia californica]|uniref:Uncharacterized protein n=1 Tax=Pichia californica TaxID=460514 RepID=A0A9P6WM55_9ASCO|nr:hypothetical protein C6P42_004050 [[Candida] californica]KAG0689661.1 hypothetical protein C6P40_004694 [[Candida] californica]
MTILLKIIGTILTIFGISSYKYLPGSYTIRFLWVVLHALYLKPINKPIKNNKNIGENISPFSTFKRYNKCCLLECDFFGFHKNNVTYFTELDLCRTECGLFALHYYFKNSILKNEKFAYVALANVSNNFLKEIKPFQNYEMNSKIIGWGDKWVWMITIFTIDEKIKIINNDTNNNNNTDNKIIPENIPPMYLNLKDGDKIGKRVSCISLAKLVFKQGRKTLDPWNIVQLSGFEDNEINLKARKNEIGVSENSNNPLELLKIFEQT